MPHAKAANHKSGTAMTGLPRFSVVICNYNYGAFVGDAIRSALAQDYPHDRMQVIVVDDGSTDGSRMVYPQFASDPRFVVVLQENRGQTAAYDAGVRVATGDYVCLLDSDDLYLPNKLARVAAHLATLGTTADEDLFLCHDLIVEDCQSDPPAALAQTWFELVGISILPDRMGLEHPGTPFPFSIPCGLVFSRSLITSCLQALPTWEFRGGADGILCPTALIKAGAVHYMREQLGRYRIHGANVFATLVDGRYVPRLNPRTRAPRTQRFLEHWLDMLDQPAQQRTLGLQYLRRREHQARQLSASRGLTPASVAIAVLADTDRSAADESAVASLQSHDTVQIKVVERCGQSDLAQMAAAWAGNDAQYVVFLRAGDRLDREFVERHLQLRQYGNLVAASCSDVRLASAQGSLVHTDVFRNGGAWRHPLQAVPPLATGLRDWIASPVSACLFQRNALLDHFFASAAQAPVALQQAGYWLALQFAHHTGGLLRIRETLATCRLPDGAPATYASMAAPRSLDRHVITPPGGDAARWLESFLAQEHALLQRWMPAAWHQQMRPWLKDQQGQA